MKDGDWGFGADDEEIRSALRNTAEVRQRQREPLFDGEITDPEEARRYLAAIEIVHVEGDR